ncbi:MAG: SdrD B-like domain-containing protein [Bacteroidota bacterium]
MALLCMTVLFANVALADGTETLGATSVATGSGFVAAGVGLTQGQPGIININVPVGATVKQVLLYWEGQNFSAAGDETIEVNATEVTGTLIGGPTLFFLTNGVTPTYSTTFRADITAMNVVNPGANAISVGGLVYDRAANGAGIYVVYDDGTGATIQLRDGNDCIYKFFASPLDVSDAQTYTFAASSSARVATLSMFSSSVEGTVSTGGTQRPNRVRITVGAVVTDYDNVLNSNDGEEWDTFTMSINIPAGETSVTVESISGPDGDEDPNTEIPRPASFTWIASSLSVPCAGLIGDFVWKDLNCDGIQDAGEPGIANVTVKLLDGSSNVIATTTTDANGYYEFSGLCEACYTVVVDETTLPAGYTPTTCSNDAGIANNSNCSPAPVCLTTSTSEDRTIDFGYCAPPECSGKIGDKVWKDVDCDGYQDSGEPGIAGVKIYLLNGNTNAVLDSTVTDANGYYYFNNLCAGCYKIKVNTSTLPTGYTATTCSNSSTSGTNSNCSPATVVLSTNSSTNLTIDFGYCPPPVCSGKIGDRVWKDKDCDGCQDSNEPGIAGVKVYLLNGNTNAVLDSTVTDANGYYYFRNLCAGCYKIKVDTSTLPTGYTATTCSNSSTSGTNSNCSPATVVLSSNSKVDLTIDFGYCPPPPCVPVTFTFCGSTSTCGTAGNIRTFTVNGISVKVSAFSRLKTSATWDKAYLGLYSYGFGVTDKYEGDGGSNKHRVDNIDKNNYVMFEFSTPVTITKAYLDAVLQDSDISVWYGTFASPYTNHLNLSDAVLGSMVTEQNTTTSSSARWATFNGGQVTANVLVIAADVMDTNPEDWFKIRKIEISCPTGPSGAANSGTPEDETGDETTTEITPATYQLMQNYPNPFNPTTEIYFELPERAATTLKIYNSLGQEIKTLVDGDLEAGVHAMQWDATDNTGRNVSSGVYFYVLRSNDFTSMKKMSLLK